MYSSFLFHHMINAGSQGVPSIPSSSPLLTQSRGRACNNNGPRLTIRDDIEVGQGTHLDNLYLEHLISSWLKTLLYKKGVQ